MVDEGGKAEKKDQLGLSICAEYIDAFMLHDIFVMADKDRDGCLNFNELSYAFKLLGFDSTEEDIKRILSDRNVLMKEKKFISVALDSLEKDKAHSENIIQTFKTITDAAYTKGKNTKYIDTDKLFSILCEGEFEYTTNLTYEEGRAVCNLLSENIEEETDMYRFTNALLNIQERLALESESSSSITTSTKEEKIEESKEGGNSQSSTMEDATKANTDSNNSKIQMQERKSKYSNAFVSSFLNLIEEDEEGNIVNEDKIISKLDYSGRSSLRKSTMGELTKKGSDSKKDEKSYFMNSLLIHVTGLDKKDTSKSMHFKNALLSPKKMSTVFSRVKV